MSRQEVIALDDTTTKTICLGNHAHSRRAVTAIIPAFNEERHLGAAIESCLRQTHPLDEIIVVDDCSTDNTGAIARGYGVTVVRPLVNTGSKAGAQTFALDYVKSDLVLVVDADTTLAPDAVEQILPAFDDRYIAAACGFVVPRRVKTTWERGRYIEYLFALSFYKQVQDFYGRPMISSGCFSVYDAARVRAVGGWSTRTMAEDMDLTWTLYESGHGVRFVPSAVSYPLEPHNLEFLGRQLRRWSHAYLQNVRLHWHTIRHMPFLVTSVVVTLTDAVLASCVFLLVLPVLAVLVSPFFVVGYVIDAPVIVVPVLVGAINRREFGLALASYPAFFAIRLVNAVFMARAILAEVVLQKTLTVYEKGH